MKNVIPITAIGPMSMASMAYVVSNSSFGFPLRKSGQGTLCSPSYIKTIRCQGFQIAVHHGRYNLLLLLSASKRAFLRTRRKEPTSGPATLRREFAMALAHLCQGKILLPCDAMTLDHPIKAYEVHGTDEAIKKQCSLTGFGYGYQ